MAHKNKATRIGFDYVHVLVDDHTRLAYAEVLPDEKGTTAAAFLVRASSYLVDHGIRHIERVLDRLLRRRARPPGAQRRALGRISLGYAR